MVPQKYVELGFDIIKYNENSLVLRFNRKTIFVFNSGSHIDVGFLTYICDSYLKIDEKRKNLSCVGIH